jgi:hypothetical protein
MMKSIQFQLTEADYVAAQSLYRPQSGWRRLTFAISIVAVIAAVALLWWTDNNALLLLYAAFICCVATYNLLWIPWKARRVFRQQKSMQAPATVAWDDNGIHARNDSGEYRHGWSDFIRWREGKTLFVLNLSDVMFLMVPKRAFPDEQTMKGFRVSLRDNVG